MCVVGGWGYGWEFGEVGKRVGTGCYKYVAVGSRRREWCRWGGKEDGEDGEGDVASTVRSISPR